MALVHTGYEPSGSNWRLETERVFNKDSDGTQAVAEYQDTGGLAILGFDLWGSLSIGDLYNAASRYGKRVYYIGLWRNPPAILGTGIDEYRGIMVRQA